MTAIRTLPDGRLVMPLKGLAIEVVGGPNAGQRQLARDEALTVGSAAGNDLVLNDPAVSRFHLEVRPAGAGIEVIDHGSTNGTFVGLLRLERAVVPPGTMLTIGHSQLRLSDGITIDVELDDQAPAGLVGRTPAMRRLVALLKRAAQSDASVLVLGESGTGKELVARALHDLGPRVERPFVTVDCGALSPTLVASDLFGHERGAFTGAERQHAGAFERADGGTLFLDEVGELPAALQATLLGVLERRRFRRLGGQKELEVDVRVVAATNRDLRSDVNSGGFRLDLYYRLAIATLQIAPLRERADDIPLLVAHFLAEAGHDGPPETLVSAAAMQELMRHRWPGNVRELRNLIEGALALGQVPAPAAAPAGSPATLAVAPDDLLARPYKEARNALLADFEARYLSALLARAGGNVSRAAREARMDRSHLIDLLRRHRLRGE